EYNMVLEARAKGSFYRVKTKIDIFANFEASRFNFCAVFNRHRRITIRHRSNLKTESTRRRSGNRLHFEASIRQRSKLVNHRKGIICNYTRNQDFSRLRTWHTDNCVLRPQTSGVYYEETKPKWTTGTLVSIFAVIRHKFIYRPGKTNQNADTLSRIPIHHNSYTPAISVISKVGLPSADEIKQAHENETLCIEQTKQFQCKLNKNGLLTHKGKILIPGSLKHRVMERFHDHLLGGHLGIAKTMKRVSQRFSWPNMVNDITVYINSCIVCAKRKAYGKKTAPLSPLEPTSFFWQRVALDIVGPLPETYKGNRYILVMSEYTSRYMLAVAMKNQS
ncbi:Uncharacterized protein APZ42_009039, partial [Daphnia magna]